MSTDVASIMLPVSRALMDRERELDTMAGGVHPNAAGAPAVVRGMKRGDPEPDGQTAAALVDTAGAECKRPRIDGTGGIGEVSQKLIKGRAGWLLSPKLVMQTSLLSCLCAVTEIHLLQMVLHMLVWPSLTSRLNSCTLIGLI